MLRALIRGLAVFLCSAIAAATATAADSATAIITRDHVSLRAAPRGSGQQQAVLWQGEMVEVRGERMDYLQVYDYRRERGGFVHVSQARRLKLTAEEAPELLSIVRFVRETPGPRRSVSVLRWPTSRRRPPKCSAAMRESKHWTRWARLRTGWRAGRHPVSQSKAAETTLSAHLDVAARYGIKFSNHERKGRMQICYDGDAFRRVLTMGSRPEQRARAALALTRHECVAPDLGPTERHRLDEWRAEMLDRVDASTLPDYLKNRVLMRRAGVWSTLAYQRARKGEAADAAANRALTELAGVKKSELTDEDLPRYNDAAMRVNASRWAAAPAAATAKRAHIVTVPGQPGETCISLVDAKNDAGSPLARRCTYGVVWTGSATLKDARDAKEIENWNLVTTVRRRASPGHVRRRPNVAHRSRMGAGDISHSGLAVSLVGAC